MVVTADVTAGTLLAVCNPLAIAAVDRTDIGFQINFFRRTMVRVPSRSPSTMLLLQTMQQSQVALLVKLVLPCSHHTMRMLRLKSAPCFASGPFDSEHLLSHTNQSGWHFGCRMIHLKSILLQNWQTSACTILTSCSRCMPCMMAQTNH